MFISCLSIENFRSFGEGENALVVNFNPGLTALVGENDTGKTTVIDAVRLALGTRDQENFRVDDYDFHQPAKGERAKEIRITCKFDDLTLADKAAFAEYLTQELQGTTQRSFLYLNWKASASVQTTGHRRFTAVETRSGKAGDGPQFDQAARALLCATYLRPLRDAERAMSAGRGSRLSQVLQHTKEVKEHGDDYDHAKGPPADLATLSILGIGDFANALLGKHKGVQSAAQNLNTKYLQELSFAGAQLEGQISVSGSRGETTARLRALLEKLDLALRDSLAPETPPNRGLGSNNILFMACELLLLGSEADGLPLLLIEEPEAHLHPQRQLRLMQFLQAKVKEARADGQKIQVIMTTHSPSLASAIDLDNMVMLQGRRAFPLACGRTNLSKSDYGFLTRFLDATKANLFFARGVLIVEGDAENILLPTLANLLKRDLTESGVSIVNVGGIGLRRFARIFQRSNPSADGEISIPVACLTDMDVMPDCAPEIIGKVKPGDAWPPKRRWRVHKDFTAEALKTLKQDIIAKASGQKVKTFVAEHWTLEYDLAYSGLAKEVWVAAHLANEDESIHAGKKGQKDVQAAAEKAYDELKAQKLSKEEECSHIYELFAGGASKAIAAQYLAVILVEQFEKKSLTAEKLRTVLPPYLVEAIEHVTVAPGGKP